MASLRKWWPWIALSWLIVAVCWPVLQDSGRIFIGGIATDAAVSVWFYDLVARAVADGQTLDTLTDFDWPQPWPRAKEFPSLADATLAAPAAWIAGWPGQWGLTQSIALAINALGAAWLARAAGCRGVGIVVAGGLMLMCRQVWFDLVVARMNVVTPGLALAAMGCWLRLMDPSLGRRARVGLVVAGAGLGAAAAAVYPPFLVMLLPVGVVLGAGPLRRGGVSALIWSSAPVLLAGAAVAGLLGEMMGERATRTCARMACPDAVHALDLYWWARGAGDVGKGLSWPGLSAGSWLLLPLVLVSRWRWRAVVLTGVALGLLALSLGPCPRAGGAEVAALASIDRWPQFWCALDQLTDYGRFATIAAAIIALLSAVGGDALYRRWRPAGVVAVVAALAVAYSWATPEVVARDKWHRPRVPPSAIFLQAAEPGPVAELPFDRSAQFMSVLFAPGSPRVNPLKARPRVEIRDPFVRWLHAVGLGDAPERAVTPDEIVASGVRWVLFEPARCVRGDAQAGGCDPATQARLRQTLGAPTVQQAGALQVWDVQALGASLAPDPPSHEGLPGAVE